MTGSEMSFHVKTLEVGLCRLQCVPSTTTCDRGT